MTEKTVIIKERIVDNKKLKPLFDVYKVTETALITAKAAVEEALVKRSAAVKAISAVAGNSGPFQFDGRTLTIMSRKGKDEEGNVTGQETWFFKQIGESVQIIE